MDEKTDELRRYVVTPLATNCYAYVSAGECLVVDPGGSGDRLADVLDDVRVTCVAATHGHGDHVGGVAALVRATGAPFAIHAADAELARHAGEMSEVGRSYDENAPAPDRDSRALRDLRGHGHLHGDGDAGSHAGRRRARGWRQRRGRGLCGRHALPGQPRPHRPRWRR